MLSSSSATLIFAIVALIASYASVEAYSVRSIARSGTNSLHMSTKKTSSTDERVFRVEIPLGEGYQSVITNFRPIFAKSTIFVTTYDIPFSLNVEKAPPGEEMSILHLLKFTHNQWIYLLNICNKSVPEYLHISPMPPKSR